MLPDRNTQTLRSRSTLFLAFSIVGIAAVAWYAADLILLSFLSILFAIFLRGLSDPLSHWLRCNEKLGLFMVVVILILLFLGGSWFFAAEFTQQADQLSVQIPRALEKVEESIKRTNAGRQIMVQVGRLDRYLLRPGVLSRATTVLSATLGVIASLGVLIVMGFFLAYEPRVYQRGITRLFHPMRRARMTEVLETLNDVMRWWIIGKTISMLFIGIVTWIGLKVLGVQLALVLAVIAALLTFIPYFGPFLAGVPAVLLGLVQSPTLALWVLALYLGIQVIEGNILTPLVERRTIRMPPAFTIFCQILFGILFGFLGVLLASPLAASSMVLVRMLYVEDVLESADIEISGATPTSI